MGSIATQHEPHVQFTVCLLSDSTYPRYFRNTVNNKLIIMVMINKKIYIPKQKKT